MLLADAYQKQNTEESNLNMIYQDIRAKNLEKSYESENYIEAISENESKFVNEYIDDGFSKSPDYKHFTTLEDRKR